MADIFAAKQGGATRLNAESRTKLPYRIPVISNPLPPEPYLSIVGFVSSSLEKTSVVDDLSA